MVKSVNYAIICSHSEGIGVLLQLCDYQYINALCLQKNIHKIRCGDLSSVLYCALSVADACNGTTTIN